MRVLRRFTIPDLRRTACAGQSNVKKCLQCMATRAYAARYERDLSGCKGFNPQFRLVWEIGPNYPSLGDNSGCKINDPCERQEAV